MAHSIIKGYEWLFMSQGGSTHFYWLIAQLPKSEFTNFVRRAAAGDAAAAAAAWGESLGHLLGSKRGRLVFEDFLRTEYSEENLLFWLACEDYKKLTSEAEILTIAQQIYAEFVQVDAARQINIDCMTREDISRNICQPSTNSFDKAQKVIYGLMEKDCYPRFLKSELFQDLLQQSEQR
ncbi:regulator of G-protein signaling 21-like [Lampris incognitus]|uniref:regulator of G-protein signaling 21-like n=1 Tax=Lampris incognitus TaxID=2546036 RepID=UPI0024B60B52|nr:regulator of G-protein signaling 21-like [Lampris incognitus]